MKLVSSRFLMEFLQTLSELDDVSLRQLGEGLSARIRGVLEREASGIVVSSHEVQRAMRRYYWRAPACIVLLMPPARTIDQLLRFARLEAFNAEGEEAGPVIPLTFLEEDAVVALRVELRQQLRDAGASPTAASNDSET